jgi:hypothetical protein
MLEGLKNVKKDLYNWKKILAIEIIGIAFWILLTLLYFPEYSLQMISGNIFYLDNAFLNLLSYQFTSSGMLGVLTSFTISFLLATVLVYTLPKLRSNTEGSAMGSLSGGIGFLSAGCASCSVGLLPLLGFSAGVAALPFQGRGLQFLSIGLIIGTLEYSGRQNSTCKVSTEEKQIL